MAKTLKAQLAELIAAYEEQGLQPAFPASPEKDEAYRRACSALASFVWRHRARIAIVPAGVDAPTYEEWKVLRGRSKHDIGASKRVSGAQ